MLFDTCVQYQNDNFLLLLSTIGWWVGWLVGRSVVLSQSENVCGAQLIFGFSTCHTTPTHFSIESRPKLLQMLCVVFFCRCTNWYDSLQSKNRSNSSLMNTLPVHTENMLAVTRPQLAAIRFAWENFNWEKTEFGKRRKKPTHTYQCRRTKR